MARNEAYREAEQKIEEARRTGTTILNLSNMKLTKLPDSLWELTALQELNLSYNQLTALPEAISKLISLQLLKLSDNKLTALPEAIGKLAALNYLTLQSNQLTALPESIGQLTKLEVFVIWTNQITMLPDSLRNLEHLKEFRIGDNPLILLPDWIGRLTRLKILDIGVLKLTNVPHWLNQLQELTQIDLDKNKLTDLPLSLAQLEHLEQIDLNDNPLNPELAAAYEQGLDAVMAYLRAKAEGGEIVLNEAKLILVGEGGVGKTSLLSALRGDQWIENRESTEGVDVDIRSLTVQTPDNGPEITLNGWDFGGQNIYRHTHQLFFTAPAVYLVVWKPREGPQQGFVKEWIKLVKHREPEAKVLVIATHGGPQQRQPDIDRQELWDLFGKDTVLDFFFVDSKPDEIGQRRGIKKLRQAIARIAATLPEMGRSVPESFQKAREALIQTDAAYLPLTQVYDICRENGMEDYIARLFVAISHRLGHLIHYEHDAALRDIVILKPDWLATAISFVLDDEATRNAQGLVSFARLSDLWDDPSRDAEDRYPAELHRIFLRLMERYDLSY